MDDRRNWKDQRQNRDRTAPKFTPFIGRRLGLRFARGDTRFHVMKVFNSILVRIPELTEDLKVAPLVLSYPIMASELLRSSQLFAFEVFLSKNICLHQLTLPPGQRIAQSPIIEKIVQTQPLR